MRDKAKSNLSYISVEEIKEYIKSSNQTYYNKMIISDNAEVKRTNFIYVNYTANYLNRLSKKITFPIYGNIADNFKSFENASNKANSKQLFDSELILESLSSNYNIEAEEDQLASPDDFDYVIKAENDQVVSNQPLYYISDRTSSWDCDTCDTEKYIQCDDFDCEGRHTWKCTNCAAKGQIICDGCGGDKKLDCRKCNGSKKLRCSNCGGDGKVVDKMDTLSAVSSSSRSSRIVKKKCGDCSGKGQIRCNKCSNGKVPCDTCSAQGKVTCPECTGHKNIVCGKCYGDKNRYGLIDCPECKAMGKMAQISYVETKISQKSVDKLFNNNNELVNVTEDTVLKFADKSVQQEVVLKNFNDVFHKDYDEIVEDVLKQIQNESDFNFEGYTNKVVREELYFQVIPCVQVQYKHMLTNTEQEVTILDFFNSPRLIIDGEVENQNSTLKDTGKKLGNFFGKLFKSKGYKQKEDTKKEIKLMIRLAKADGKIEDSEKVFLSSKITSLDMFTHVEKTDLFNMMDDSMLPELEPDDIKFSSSDKFSEVFQNLQTMAAEDGDVANSEQELLDKIKSLNN